MVVEESKENVKKRAREDDSESDSSEAKLIRVDLSDLEQDNPDSESIIKINSSDTMLIHDDLFNIADESDETVIQGLDSVIKSFEEEILPPANGGKVEPYGGACLPDLGYLLEASDDELGLPPTFSGEEEKLSNVDLTIETEAGTSGGGFGETLGFENEIPSYDSFEYRLGDDSVSNSYNDSVDFVTLGGLFDYSDDSCAPVEIPGGQLQPESLPAL